ncbi:MAG TPA: tRNA (adenosine(37)-N6)-dimethylallyltransferase MiaA [Gaiellaceae bacterium]|nr:tRNA (adenosine(37)-N6)-dimethylallyltransferase MiaA [Gaiellaceae bacterium]
MASNSPAAKPLSPPNVLAIFGPTASGKSAVAQALLARLDADVVSADSAAVYAGIPIITAAPDYPARLVGVFPLTHDVSVAEYQRLAHGAIDEVIGNGRTAIVVGGTGLYLRAAVSSLEFPPAPAPGAREEWGSFYDEAGGDEAHAQLAQRDPPAAARVHPNDRRRVVRALELAAAGSSLAPATDRLWTDDVRQPTLFVSLEVADEELERRIRARAESMLDAGAAAEASAAWAAPLSETARKVLGLEAFATLGPGEAVEAVVLATRKLARYQRKWIRRVPGVVTLGADRSPEELADEIVALASARERLPRS